jgi:PTH2 family peptidyl-tRNA hydrolase
LSSFRASRRRKVIKQVIVVNEALDLPKGKLAAQVAHAAVDAFINAPSESQRAWLQEGMPKIVLRGESESELFELERRARESGLPVALIRDAGHTIVAPGTPTCIGIGPAADEQVDRLTGGKALLK